jgi:hypothetical protein
VSHRFVPVIGGILYKYPRPNPTPSAGLPTTISHKLDAKPPRWRRRSAGRKRETTGGVARGRCRRACCSPRECKPCASHQPLGFFYICFMSSPLPFFFLSRRFRSNVVRRWLNWLPRGKRLPSCKANSRRMGRVTPFG